MKHFASVLLFLLTPLFTYSQVNIVNVEKNNSPSHERFINGISTKQDVGGVDVTINTQQFKHHYNEGVNINGSTYYVANATPQTLEVPSGITLTNYNPFKVTVLIEYAADYARKDWYYEVSDKDLKYNVQTVVLGADKTGEGVSKTIFIKQNNYPIIAHISGITTITRKMGQ